jgi:hypothetical protein
MVEAIPIGFINITFVGADLGIYDSGYTDKFYAKLALPTTVQNP